MIDFKGWLTNIPKQYRTHQNADLPLEEYFEIYKESFRKVSIGCSFAPDLVEQMYRRENGVTNTSDAQKLAILKVLIHDLGMQDIRLGIKWNRVVDSQENFDFSYYHPYLDYCLSNNVQVCLNVGPIKTFGWPEEHIPQHIIEKCSVGLGSRVDEKSEIAKFALEYLYTLLSYIKSSYTKEKLANLVILQLENEPYNKFGKLKIALQQGYVIEIIKNIHSFFPDKKILLSSAETRNTSQIVSTIKKISNQGKIDGNTFVCGINYYYNLPNFIKLPELGPIDNITVSNFLQRSTHTSNIKNAKKLGYDVEVTEAQFEQWGRAYLSPGNSFHEAKYLFARIAENILDPKEGGLIRLWGFERYAKKYIEHTLTSEHRQIIDLIQKINAGSNPAA